MPNDIIIGSEFNYKIDTSHGLSADGYIATGTESIVYKGLKISRSGDIILSCVLKFKLKAIVVGAEEGRSRIVNVYDRFRTHDLKIFDDLQDCRSVVRIFDVIEDLGDFSVTDTHVAAGQKSISINRDNFFCVVEEYIDGWSLEEYCRDEYWKLTETVDCGNNLKKKIPFHEFYDEKKQQMLESYSRDYDEVIRYQSEMFDYMMNLCEILQYITDTKHILHLDIKPDNIMVTKYGKELVLIDFGRSEYMDPGTHAVRSTLGEADYRSEESIARMFQYGTLGYAAPECYAKPVSGSALPFDNSCFELGRMSIESDIFSFGATFWECLNVFELYTKSRDFATDKSLGGSYNFYRTQMLNDKAYCDRDLSLTSPHYHEKLEEIIKKCTRKRQPGYLNSPDYYHDYNSLRQDIQYAKESAPALVKSENLKVRNSFSVVGVMAGLLCVLLMIGIFLKLTSNYFSGQKINSIISTYNPTKIELLEDAALEQMNSSTEVEKHTLYTRIYEFFRSEENELNYSESTVLTEMLRNMRENGFVSQSVDDMLLNVSQRDLSRCIENIVTSSIESDGAGYRLAVQIYNAQKRKDLLVCYNTLIENAADSRYRPLVVRLAQDLNHDAQISLIAKEIANTNPDNKDLEEIEFEIAGTLDDIISEVV